MQNHGQFTVLWTGDGSPSLRGETEPMHHLGGAYAETQYIYGEALRRLNTLKNLKVWKVLVVGLGLGYIELLSVAEALKNDRKIQILTYEIEQDLVEMFLEWLSGNSENLVYDRILDYFTENYPGLNLKQELYQLYKNGNWEIKGALNNSSLPSQNFDLIQFDAFSGKTTPDLWTEEFLNLFLERVATVSPVIFSTYACTGILKRALKNSGFQVEKRDGFLGKRNSTIAVKI